MATAELAASTAIESVRPNLADAARLPFADNSFDVIISINVFEHIDDPYTTLLECKRVLRPDGLMFLHFPPFFSPWGAHLEGWINFPWPHVFFPDRVLIEAARQIDLEHRQNENYIPPAQVEWSKLSRLPELNRVTAAQFARLVAMVGLRVIRCEMLPFGRHFLTNKGLWAAGLLMLLRGSGGGACVQGSRDDQNGLYSSQR